MGDLSFRDLLIGTWTGKGDGGAEIVLDIKDNNKFTMTITETGWLDKAFARALGDSAEGEWVLDGRYLEFRHKMSTSRLGKVYSLFPGVGRILNLVYDFLGLGPFEGANVTHLCCTHLRFADSRYYLKRVGPCPCGQGPLRTQPTDHSL